MKNYFKLALMLLFFNSSVIAQSDFALDIRNLENGIQLWNDQQIWEYTNKFGIQDTFFNNNREIKERYRILKYLGTTDLDKYCLLIKDSGEKKYDFDNYYRAMKSNNIIKIKDWLDLLVTYPKVSEVFIEELGGGTSDGFNSFINELVKKEKLVFVNNGSVIITKNTRESFNKYKHLKRLK